MGKEQASFGTCLILSLHPILLESPQGYSERSFIAYFLSTEARLDFPVCDKSAGLIAFPRPGILRNYPQHDFMITCCLYIFQYFFHHLGAIAFSPLVLQAVNADELCIIWHIVVSGFIPICDTVRCPIHFQNVSVTLLLLQQPLIHGCGTGEIGCFL